MALFQPGLVTKYASWAHPIYLISGGVAQLSDTTSVVAYLDAGGSWSNWGHGYQVGLTYAAGARIEYDAGADQLYTYESVQNGNQGRGINDPTWWTQLTAAQDGLGADDSRWISIPGVARIDRNPSGYIWHPHFYANATVDSAARWVTACGPGQYSYYGSNPSPAVRMSATADTCYYSTLEEDLDQTRVRIWRVVAGSKTLLGVSNWLPWTGGRLCTFAFGTTIGACLERQDMSDSTTGWPGSAMLGGYGAAYHPAFEIALTVTDTTIPLASGPYVGMRATAGVNQSVHEWYGGSYGVLSADTPVVTGNQATLSGTRRPGTTITVTKV